MKSNELQNQHDSVLEIPHFAHGYLLCQSMYLAPSIRESGEDDTWEQVTVPLSTGLDCEYQEYDLNFWIDDEDDGRLICTAYEVRRDEAGQAHTNTDEWLRLW